MKVYDLIEQLSKYHDLDDDIFCEYWLSSDIADIINEEDIPKEALTYIIDQLEDCGYHGGIGNEDLCFAIDQYYDEWKAIPAKVKYGEPFDETDRL